MSDPMHDLLQDAGRRWRAAQPAPPEPDLARLAPRIRQVMDEYLRSRQDEALDLVADPGLTVFTYGAEPGSESERNLALLGTWAATERSERSAAV